VNDRSIPTRKSHPARCHLVENRTEREQVCPRIQLLATCLLRRHISDGAHRRAGAGQEFPRRCGGHLRDTNARASRDYLRQTKIEDFGVAQFGHKKICWIDVSMDDSLSVRCFERIGNLDCQLQHLVERERPPRNAVLQCFAVEELHGNELLAVLLSDVVNRADVRVI
jgi:hypothetical protein